MLYTVHHIVAKTGLFLTGGLIERGRVEPDGAARRHGADRAVIAVLFLVPALSLVGIPPLSGFIAKFALVDAAAARSSYVILGGVAGGQPAHPLLAHEGVDRGVLEPGPRSVPGANVPLGRAARLRC